MAEYGPGSKVVLNGLTYESAGVTLNWRLPPSQIEEGALRELQAFSWAWRCSRCGGSGTSQSKPGMCPQCGERPSSKPEGFVTKQRLQPGGFATDIRKPAEVDYQHPGDNGQVETWISSGKGSFLALGSPARVLYRHTADGRMMWMHGGRNGKGFAVCLRCGRTDHMTAAGKRPSSMDEHRRLRGGRGAKWREEEVSPVCEAGGESYAVKERLWLGGDTRTDVLEVRLVQPGTGDPRLLERAEAWTLAVALRKEGARLLCIDERELGCGVARRHLASSEGAPTGWAVLLWDTAAGGAGYCEELTTHLSTLLERARGAADCPNDCDGICHACLLTHDTQRYADDIDRSLLDGLLDDGTLAGLALPAGAVGWGAETRQEWQAPLRGLLREARRSGATRVRIHLHGELATLDWTGHKVLSSLEELVAKELVIDPAALDSADWRTKMHLQVLSESPNVSVLVGEAPTRDGFRVWARLRGARGVDFITNSEAGTQMDDRWGWGEEGETWAYATSEAVWSAAESPGRLVTPGDAASMLAVRDSARGPLATFGARFVDLLDRQVEGGFVARFRGRPVVSLRYEDRYVRTPVAVALLHRLLRELAVRGVLGAESSLVVSTEQPLNHEQQKVPELAYEGWARTESVQHILEHVVGDLGMPTEVRVSKRFSEGAPNHRRRMVLTTEDGEEHELWLDRGLGFATTKTGTPFDFGAPLSQQVDDLLTRDWVTVPLESHEAYAVFHSS